MGFIFRRMILLTIACHYKNQNKNRGFDKIHISEGKNGTLLYYSKLSKKTT